MRYVLLLFTFGRDRARSKPSVLLRLLYNLLTVMSCHDKFLKHAYGGLLPPSAHIFDTTFDFTKNNIVNFFLVVKLKALDKSYVCR